MLHADGPRPLPIVCLHCCTGLAIKSVSHLAGEELSTSLLGAKAAHINTAHHNDHEHVSKEAHCRVANLYYVDPQPEADAAVLMALMHGNKRVTP